MQYKSINERLDELVKVFVELLSPEGMNSFTKDEANELISSIRAYLIDYPGELIYEQNMDAVNRRMTAIDFLWKMYDDDHHYDEMFFGDNVDYITNYASAYIKRARMIRPLFVTTKKHVGKEFEFYFKEATKAWLNGCEQAAIIICNSLLEDTLRNKLCHVDINYVYELFNSQGSKSNPSIGMNHLKDFA